MWLLMAFVLLLLSFWVRVGDLQLTPFGPGFVRQDAYDRSRGSGKDLLHQRILHLYFAEQAFGIRECRVGDRAD